MLLQRGDQCSSLPVEESEGRLSSNLASHLAPDLPLSLATLRQRYSSAQQGHIVDCLSQLPPSAANAFAAQLASFDPCRVSTIFRQALQRHQEKTAASKARESSTENLRSLTSPSTSTPGSCEASLASGVEISAPRSSASSDGRRNGESLAPWRSSRDGEGGDGEEASTSPRAAARGPTDGEKEVESDERETKYAESVRRNARNGTARNDSCEDGEEEAAGFHLPARCCRDTCFPPDLVSWRRLEADPQRHANGDCARGNEAKEPGDNDAVNAEEGSLAKGLECLYSRLETSSCPLLRLIDMPENVRHHWFSRGLDLIREGRVAVLVLAGGDGTRLAFAGPKGKLPAGPLSRKSIFQIFAERLLRLCALAEETAEGVEPGSAAPTPHRETANATGEAAGEDAASARSRKAIKRTGDSTVRSGRRSRVAIPLLIMTSERNDAETQAFFAEHDYFGLDPSTVSFFRQPSLPTFSPDGRMLLQAPGRMQTAPNGNGGVFSALETSGLLRQLEAKGVVGIQVCSVDNLLAKVADPLFFGLCVDAKVPVGNKVLARRDPYEKVGAMCQVVAERSTGTATKTGRGGEAGEARGERNGEESREARRGDGEARKPQRGRKLLPAVIEYSELPDEVRLARSESANLSSSGREGGGDTSRGEVGDRSAKNSEKAADLLFAWGNACLHYFDLEFIKAVLRNSKALDASYHLALKNVNAFLPPVAVEGDIRVEKTNGRQGEAGGPVTSEWIPVKQGWKLELFIFDVFAMASRVLCVEVSRAEEFSPIKNASPIPDPRRLSEISEDTLFSAQRDMSRLHCSWLRRAGVSIGDSEGTAKKRLQVTQTKNVENGEGRTHGSIDANDEGQETEDEDRDFSECFCEISSCVSYGGEGLEALVARGCVPSYVTLPFALEN
ncbi:UTP-glucose-1-phosphate uridylyltransferase subfamily protein [Toxoplasma gondii VEG]|uniref:UDP-N-acetylglucosamine diphosphorylase n=2 Tax=Toxoplasma gondii TaxID=5811 RepID=B9QEV9_TOXGV|nr:UTP-glucose-1-phosphate uridylyltransferase subfamily protein [Toxoplasma gondii VEG]KFG32541.1 UTP-glucose-1-phosphate uridylyltransferase subfamily protein [Toxoplasma gondii p89]CEL75793.1 TPA: UDP-N-acetylhexosamine pyrophosphorylase,putative [Toxoplasma gondii VEG]